MASYANAEPRIVNAHKSGAFTFEASRHKPTKVKVKGNDIWLLDGYMGDLVRLEYKREGGFFPTARFSLGAWLNQEGRKISVNGENQEYSKDGAEFFDFDIFGDRLAIVFGEKGKHKLAVFVMTEIQPKMVSGRLLAMPEIPKDFAINVISFNGLGELFVWAPDSENFLKFPANLVGPLVNFTIEKEDLPVKPSQALLSEIDNQFYIIQTLASKLSLLSLQDGKVSIKQLATFGLRPGQVIFPKGVAWVKTPNVVLVSDSLTGTIQAINPDDLKSPLLLGDTNSNEILHIKHPSSLAWLDKNNTLLIVDALTGELVAFETDFANSKPIDIETKNLLKDNSLTEPGIHAPCAQCHDGSIVNSLFVFQSDKTQHHFRVDKALEEKISKKFPPKDGMLTCTSCHSHHARTAENKFLKAPLTGKDTICKACHEQMVMDPSKGHPVEGEVTNKTILSQMIISGVSSSTEISCVSCHNIHNPVDANEGLFREKTNELCSGCHQNKMSTTLGHPISTGLEAKNEPQKPQCLSCHSIHSDSSKSHNSIAETDNNSETPTKKVKKASCESCHEKQKGVKNSGHRGVHAKLTEELFTQDIKNIDNHLGKDNDCTLCHQMHENEHSEKLLKEVKLFAEGASKKDMASSLCLACHVDNKDKEKRYFSHPGNLIFNNTKEGAKNVSLLNQDFKPYTDKDKIGYLTCLSCHDPHLGKDKNEMMLRNYEDMDPFCSKCHGDEGLTRYKYFHTKRYRK